MSEKAFNENVVDYTHILAVNEAVVMTSSNESHDPLSLGFLDIVDRNFLMLYALAFALYLVTIILFAKYLLIKKESLLQRVSSIIFYLFGILNGKG